MSRDNKPSFEMDDNFKTFEKAPVAGALNIRQWSFARREIILAAVAFVLLILCVVFIGLYGYEKNEKSDRIIVQEQEQDQQQNQQQDYCDDESCLQTASRAVHLMNKSVDPCEDFYHYACGNYKNFRTVSFDRDATEVTLDIKLRNEEKLLEVMEKLIDRHHDRSTERKIKEFFQSCTDRYQREQLLGTPFLNQVVPALGGWDLLGTWNEDDWDFSTALKIVQADFQTRVLYEPYVSRGFDLTHPNIEVHPATAGKWMRYRWFHGSEHQKYRDDYKNFMRHVASLFMRDANVTFDPQTQATKLDQFVEDTIALETKIAQVGPGGGRIFSYNSFGTITSSIYFYEPFEEILTYTLAHLKLYTNNIIDWVEQFSYLYKDISIDGNTDASLYSSWYFTRMSRMIARLPDADRKRMLHHYLIWRVAENLLQDLSWEYVHANMQIYADLYGATPEPDLYHHCFDKVSSYMPDALGSLFIADHFVDANRQQVKDITENLKVVLQEQLDNTPWMDAQTKAYAKNKLDATSFKMGYPDWMADPVAIDSFYDELQINVSDYFGSISSANAFLRSRESQVLKSGSGIERWVHHVYDTAISMRWSSNAIVVPAGILQYPIYDHTQPHYKTFGSLGGILGGFLYHVTDDYGKSYDTEGNYLRDETWWTNKTIHSYEPLKKFVADIYRQATANVTNSDGQRRTFSIDWTGYTTHAIATINGVRLALKGYRKWVSERGIAEKMLPGIDLTKDQMVFLSYAQGACYKRSDFWGVYFAYSENLEDDLEVNIAMSLLPEFSEAFKCKKTAKMNAPRKIDDY